MKMSRRKVRETIFLLLFRIEFNTQEELQEQMKWYFLTLQLPVNSVTQ